MDNPLIKAVIALAVALYIVFSIPVFVMTGLLLAHGETCQGRIFAIAVIATLPVPVLMWFITYYIKRKQVYLISAATLIILSILLLGINYALTPDGLPLPNSPVRSCFTDASSYQRTSMANMVPEMDQLILATYVIPSMDVLMDKPHTSELRNQIRAVYGEMRRNPEFENLGSVLDQTYRQLFLGKPTIGHFYEYIPANKQGRLPVVIFLHGSFGNLKGYLWVWKRIADEYGFAIVAPTFGMGNWEFPGGDKVIEEALRYCTSHPRMDSSRIYLAGLSNGGRGVCIGAVRSPNTYKGLIFISPVLDQNMLLTNQFVAAWKNKPVLILHGVADNRIPVSCIKSAAEALDARGLRTECELYDGQTHFLFFTIRDKVQERIGNWLKIN